MNVWFREHIYNSGAVSYYYTSSEFLTGKEMNVTSLNTSSGREEQKASPFSFSVR
jgi:hypothetical protein